MKKYAIAAAAILSLLACAPAEAGIRHKIFTVVKAPYTMAKCWIYGSVCGLGLGALEIMVEWDK